MIINRHNQATWEVYNTILAGDTREFFTIIDAGHEDQHDNDGEQGHVEDASQEHLGIHDSSDVLDSDDLDGHEGARVPEWMLLDVETDLKNKFRTDIFRVKGLPFYNMRPPQSHSERGSLRIEIVELGFCSDTRWEAKLEEKKRQHAQLARLLQEA